MRNSPPSSTTDDGPAHSPLSPSGSKRWLSCKASVGFIAKHKGDIPADTGSKYSDEGNEAHEFAARLLNREKGPRPRSSEMVACIEEGYVPFVRAAIERAECVRFKPEVRVPLFYDRSQKGTCDAPIIGKKRAIFIDLKYGEGISVEAKFNPQLAIYAESTIRDRCPYMHKNTPLELVIYQPRAKDNRFVRRWELTRGELAEFCKEISRTASDIILDPDDQPFAPEAETTCRFCPAKAFCSHYAAHLLEETPAPVAKALSSVEARISLPVPNKMSESQIIKVLRVRKDLIDWFEEMEAYVVHKMEKGSKYEGLKLVAAVTQRRWKDEKEAAAHLRKLFDQDELFSRSFIGPAGASKLIKGLKKKPDTRFLDRLAKLIVKPDGAPQLAPKEDARPAIETSAGSELL